MTDPKDFPLTSAIVGAIYSKFGPEGLTRLAAENVAAVLKMIRDAGFTVLDGPHPIDQADKSRTILAYFGEGTDRGLYTARRMTPDGQDVGYWQILDLGLSFDWMRHNQPTEFWYPPE